MLTLAVNHVDDEKMYEVNMAVTFSWILL